MIKTFDDYIKTQDDANNYKKSVLKLIDYYILNDDEYVKKHENIVKTYERCFDFYFSNDNYFVIKHFDRNEDVNMIFFKINSVDYKNLLKFIDNPELYKDTKKFNL